LIQLEGSYQPSYFPVGKIADKAVCRTELTKNALLQTVFLAIFLTGLL